MALYEQDLAYVHHEGFGDYARGAAPGLLAALRDRGIDGGTVVDLGCGSGIWLRALTDAGYTGVGVDQSAAMLDLARRVAPEAELHLSGLREFTPPPCDAITALGEGLCYLPSEGTALDFPALFAVVAAALHPGGLFAFDLLVEGEPMAYRNYRRGEDWAILFEVAEQVEQSTLTRDQTIFRRQGDLYRRSHELHRLRVCSAVAVTSQLEDAGFRVAVGPSYGAFELPPRRLAFLAAR